MFPAKSFYVRFFQHCKFLRISADTFLDLAVGDILQYRNSNLIVQSNLRVLPLPSFSLEYHPYSLVSYDFHAPRLRSLLLAQFFDFPQSTEASLSDNARRLPTTFFSDAIKRV